MFPRWVTVLVFQDFEQLRQIVKTCPYLRELKRFKTKYLIVGMVTWKDLEEVQGGLSEPIDVFDGHVTSKGCRQSKMNTLKDDPKGL